jgi:hypothetical protein
MNLNRKNIAGDASYCTLHPIHCIYVHVSYLDIYDRPRRARTREATGASTAEEANPEQG